MSKYIVAYVSGIAMQVAVKITDNYTMGVIEAFLPDENTLTPKEEKQWIKDNNKRMKSICKLLNENNL